MAHGTKPYGRTQAQQTIYGVQDMAELAARQGSIDTFDRRGNVVWLDDFEAGIYHWDIGWIGAANICRIDYNTSRNGICSAVMQPTVGDGNQAYLEHYNPFNVEGGLGQEVSFSLAGNSGVIQIRFRVYSTVRSLEAGIRYDPVTDVLEYLDNTLAWALLAPNVALGIPAPGLHRVFRLFHTCKIVVDTLNAQYLRILLDDNIYTRRPWPTNDAGPAATAYVRIRLIEEALDVPVNYAYWDDEILTQNEP